MSDRTAQGGHAGRPDAAGGLDFSGLLQRVPAIVYIADQGDHGVWHYASAQIETVLGYTADEWCADPELWLDSLHPDDRSWVREVEADLNRKGIEGGGPVEYRMLHRDGHVVWVRDDAALVRDTDGVRRWHGVLSDITERKLTEAELERAAAQHAAVAALGEHALEGASATDLAHEALRAAVELLSVDVGAVIELTDDRSGFSFLVTHGVDPAMAAGIVPAGEATGPGYALTHGRVVISDWETETRFVASPQLVELGVRSGMSVVIESRRGPYGVLGLHSRRRREFSRIDVDFAQALANVLGDAVERQHTENDIRHRALHDPLTGLPNRTLFMDRLGQAVRHLRRRDTTAAILFLDLDRFKLVNDSLGHKVGDDLLAAAAPRLKQAVRASDTVARFGADEFGILLEDVAGEHDAVEMAQRIAGVFNRPFVLEGTEHFVTTSVGIVLATGGERPEDLIRDADAAMNRAKERGRARYELFDERLRGRALSRLRVENDLRRALERDEFTLDYQPIVSLADRSIVGVEALVRWEHPQRGRVPPMEFIPVAEENGLIEPIGRWVLEHACHQAAAWYERRPDARPLSIAVNLSAVQFEHGNLPETVAAALRGSGLEPELLSLEVTESVMMGHGEELTRTLAALKALGARLILDDFGTGYSSLAYLTRLPLDALKVDRSFVDGLGTESRDTGVTEAIIAMSQALALDVVGEGAETELQVAQLDRLGCPYVQGYYFSRPVPAPEITALLTRSAPFSDRG